jgi:hypothetical protein
MGDRKPCQARHHFHFALVSNHLLHLMSLDVRKQQEGTKKGINCGVRSPLLCPSAPCCQQSGAQLGPAGTAGQPRLTQRLWL